MYLNNRRNLYTPYQCINKIIEESPQTCQGALWLGDYTAALDKELLKEKQIKTVITTASGLGVHYNA